MASKVAQKKLSGNNLLIVLALVTLLALGITALAAKTMIADILLNNKVLTAKNEADANLKTDLDAAPKLVDAFNALGNQAGVLSDALPVTSDFPALLVEMENITNDTGMLLKSVDPDTGGLGGTSVTASAASAATTTASSAGATGGTAAAGSSDASSGGIAAPTPQTYNFTLDLNGTYPNVLRMLSDLETSARPMRVTSMTLGGVTGALNVQLGVTTYYMDKAQLPIGTETVK